MTCTGCNLTWSAKTQISGSAVNLHCSGIFLNSGAIWYGTPPLIINTTNSTPWGTASPYIVADPLGHWPTNGNCTGQGTGCHQSTPCYGVPLISLNPLPGYSYTVTAFNSHTGSFDCGVTDYVTFVGTLSGLAVTYPITVAVSCRGCCECTGGGCGCGGC